MTPGVVFNNQVEIVKERLQKHIDNGDHALIVEHNIYTPDSAAMVTFTKLYPHFALGYVYNKSSETKEPYTLTYNALICHDFDKQSRWDNGQSLYE